MSEFGPGPEETGGESWQEPTLEVVEGSDEDAAERVTLEELIPRFDFMETPDMVAEREALELLAGAGPIEREAFMTHYLAYDSAGTEQVLGYQGSNEVSLGKCLADIRLMAIGGFYEQAIEQLDETIACLGETDAHNFLAAFQQARAGLEAEILKRANQ